jgi:cation diffusion facilitator CzcD-associated flavoprotein CzcO
MFSQRVCIIGAGCSGFTTAKRLKDFGIAYDQFEASDNIGGNWYFKNPNGMSTILTTMLTISVCATRYNSTRGWKMRAATMMTFGM